MQGLVLSRVLLEEMLEHARREYPRECVGLLFGQERRVERHVTLPNVAALPETTFYAEPDALLKALREAETRRDEHLAVYHSHPRGPATPSPTDLAQAYSGVAHLIIVPNPLSCRAFEIENEGYRELELVVEEATRGSAVRQSTVGNL